MPASELEELVQLTYRNMDRPTLDAAYDNTKAVADFPRTFANFRSRSAGLYARRQCRRDVVYGPRARQRFDWFPAEGPDAPLFVFIHGGYWQNCIKEDFAFIAEGPLANGFQVVLAEYTLAPEASMTEIVAEIGVLIDHLANDRSALGTGGSPICLSGHSAGGHLTLMHRSHPAVAFAMPVSALVDLEPISLCWLNERLQLSREEIERFSPLHSVKPGAPTLLTVGATELPELVRHSREYAGACKAAGESVSCKPVEGCDHFSVLEDLALPNGHQMRALLAFIEAVCQSQSGVHLE